MARDETTVPPRTYLTVFVLLVIFTLLEVGVRYVPGLPSAVKIAALVLLAGTKVMLVLLFFMHLKYDETLFWLPVVIAFISGGALLLIVTLTPQALGVPSGGAQPAAGTAHAMPGMGGEPANPTPGSVGDAQAGQQLAQQQGCSGCHSTDGSAGTGPTFLGLYGKTVTLSDGSTVTADEQYLTRSIVSPDAQIVQGYSPGIMPSTFGQQLSQTQIADLVAYLQSLGQQGQSAAATPAPSQASGTAAESSGTPAAQPSGTPSAAASPAPTGAATQSGASGTAVPGGAAATAVPAATMAMTAMPATSGTPAATTTPVAAAPAATGTAASATPAPTEASPAAAATATAPSGAAAIQAGQQLAQQQGCTACHSINGGAGIGPTWQGLYGSTVTLSDGSTVTADEQYLTQAVVAPDAQVVQGYVPGVMPGSYGQQLSQEQVADLVAYMASLGQPGGTPSASPAAAAATPTALADAIDVANSEPVPTPSTDAAVIHAGLHLAQDNDCFSCHSPDGSPADSPTWKGLYLSSVALDDGTTITADAGYLARSIVDPDAQVVQGYMAGMMPSFAATLSGEQVNDLVSYVASLR